MWRRLRNNAFKPEGGEIMEAINSSTVITYGRPRIEPTACRQTASSRALPAANGGKNPRRDPAAADGRPHSEAAREDCLLLEYRNFASCLKNNFPFSRSRIRFCARLTKSRITTGFTTPSPVSRRRRWGAVTQASGSRRSVTLERSAICLPKKNARTRSWSRSSR